MTREEWLNALIDELRPDFSSAGAIIPTAVRVTCGWPSTGSRTPRIGECWGPESSKDKHAEVSISPLLDDPIEVGEILVHELVHTAVGTQHGHKAPFRRVALALGLEGKMTATSASLALRARLLDLTDRIGSYPHARIKINRKIQSTRMLKLLCPSCGYLVRTSQKWLDLGTPTCVCATKMEAC